ncbi:MAG: GNAT family N-acetyltransferase [Candidatus Latescibacteria bacterium]|nr:GNAT family N-acetyltransferase [Candidatus Latescibacterota bacterium]
MPPNGEPVRVPTALPGLEIRKARTADLEAVEAIVSKAGTHPGVASFLEAYYGPEAAVSERIRNRMDTALIAWHDGHGIGYLACGQDETVGALGPWAVRPDRQGFGVGSALMVSMMRMLRARGVRLLEATVPERPGAALRICQKLGFREYATTARRVSGWEAERFETAAAWHHFEKRLRG